MRHFTFHFWKCYHILIAGAAVLAVACVSLIGYAAWEYMTWRNKMIAWDFGTIERLCGGNTGDERLLDVRFVKQWEYKAFKKTTDGRQVWIYWKLSKRHCGNWMLVDPTQSALIRPFNERFPKGAPPRGGVDCLGFPIDEAEFWNRRDTMLNR